MGAGPASGKGLEERLIRLSKCLASLKVDYGINVNLLTAACGELLGADCAVYSRRDHDLLCAYGQWHTSADFSSTGDAAGQSCTDVIARDEDEPAYIEDLLDTPYAQSDPNVRRYGLRTYLGQVVRCDGKAVGSLCALFNHPVKMSTDEKNILKILAAAMGAEEDRSERTKELWSAEERFRSLFESSRDAIMTLEPPSWALTAGNPAAMSLFRAKDMEEFRSHGFAELSPERQSDGCASAGKIREIIESAMLEGSRFFEWTHKRLDGTEFFADVLLTRVESAGKTFLQATVRDITERNRNAQTVRVSEVRYRRLFEAAQDGILILDAEDGDIVDANQFLADLLGMEREKFIGKKVWEIGTFKDIVANKAKFEELQSFGYVRYANLPLQTVNGRQVEVEFVSNVYLVDQRKVIQCNIRDNTEREQAQVERKKLQSQLAQAQKMEVVGRLAGGVAHDFNNLLTVILGNCSFLLNDIPKNDPRHEDVEQIRSTGERAANLTRQLLAFSRKQIMQPQVLDLNAGLSDMEKLLRRLIGEDIRPSFVRAKDLALVKMDPGQVEQVIMNLAINARDAMPKGGELSIETKNIDVAVITPLDHDAAMPPGRYVLLTVRDTGTGMDAAALGHIFEPFFTTKELGMGTGLGLATVYGIIKQSDGFIDVQSEPGRGTTFKVFLPAVAAALPEGKAGEKGAQAKPPAEKSRRTLLLVEDDAAVRRIACRILKGSGYTVLEAGSAREALAHADEDFDLVLSDIVLPDMSGVALFAKLKKGRPIPAIYMSGYTDNPDIRSVLAQSGNRFLQKPFTAEALRNKVREVLT
jgi:PAS domain S-box-containing protein